MKPPVAARRPLVRELHGDRFTDDYAWLRDRERRDPDVLAYLDAENAYFDHAMAHALPLREKLFEEIKGRIKETDQSAPVLWDDWWYYDRTVEGLQYRIECRKPRSLDAPEEVLLDLNDLALGHEQFRLGAFSLSPDHALLAYSTDTTGAEEFTLAIKDLRTGELLPDRIAPIEYTCAWAPDGRTLYYTRFDEARRPHQLWRHALGSDQADDVLVLEEPDKAFYVHAVVTKSRRFLLVRIGSAITDEWRFIDLAADPAGPPEVLVPRRHGIECRVTQRGDRFVITTNEDAKDFRVMEAPVADPRRENWTEILPHRPGVKIEYVEPFLSFLAIFERERGVERIRIQTEADHHYVGFPDPVFTIWPDWNPMEDAAVLRFGYSSLVIPPTEYDYDPVARTLTVVKRQEVLGGYDPGDYTSERIWARAPDGVEVPVSLVYRRDFPRDGTRPLWLYGYGSYGASSDPAFASTRLSLLDRGFAFAIAHIRGGGDLGEEWRDAGKLERKPNTFADFVACAEHLVAERYTSPERLVIRGGSAGGLLVGAVVNMRPDLFAAAVAEVPFVDVISTILDPTLLFSAMEWEEWGNPNDPEPYRWIRTYSPYENVEAKAYPHLLVTAGLHDPRVNYWEPAKWVARLRALRTDDRRLFLWTRMVAGHMGASGRYDRIRDDALVYAFVLDTLGITA